MSFTHPMITCHPLITCRSVITCHAFITCHSLITFIHSSIDHMSFTDPMITCHPLIICRSVITCHRFITCHSFTRPMDFHPGGCQLGFVPDQLRKRYLSLQDEGLHFSAASGQTWPVAEAMTFRCRVVPSH